MSTFAIAAVGLLASLWPFHGSQVSTKAYTLPTWSFSQSRDRFTQHLTCQVYTGPRGRPLVSYGRQAVTFRFPATVNTLQADYRLDSGPTRSWRDELPTLAETGFTPDRGGLDNPTGGLITLPARELSGVHLVTIRATPGSRPRAFSIDGLDDAIAAARAQGCGADAFSG